MSRRPKSPREMEPFWLRMVAEELIEGPAELVSLLLSIDEAVFRLDCGILSPSFSLSVASRDELEDEWLDDLEVT